MKAVVYDQYGGPDKLRIEEMRKPSPKGGEVLVRVYSSSINGADDDMLKGTAFGRFSGLFKPGYKVLGSDIAGVVESIGINVKTLSINDRVFADLSEHRFGGFSEYVVVKESALSLIPEDMTFEEAAATPSAGTIALQSINNRKKIQPEEKVLVNGAGGGMGTFAVQMAKALGAEVTGVDKGDKLQGILKIGADHVIDYTQEKFTKKGITYDRIIDCKAFHSPMQYRKALNKGGVYYMIGGSMSSLIRVTFGGLIIRLFSDKFIGLLMGQFNRKVDMDVLKEMYTAKTVVPIISKVFELEDISKAFEYYVQSDVVGKVIINMRKH